MRAEGIVGPVLATASDVRQINELFSEAFTERYRRDGMAGVRVPWLNQNIWEQAIELVGTGAMLWRDRHGDLAAFNLAHCAGTQGWMGPLAVRSRYQGDGFGSEIVRAAISHLIKAGATTIGVETMPRTIENIGFYSQLGFLPGHLTFTLQRIGIAANPGRSPRLSRMMPSEQTVLLKQIAALTEQVAGGVDFSREIALTIKYGLGDVTALYGEDGSLRAWALWQTAPLASGHQADCIRLLKLVATNLDAALELVELLDKLLSELQLEFLSIRCEGRMQELYAGLIDAGFRVNWTDLRMTLAGYGEPSYRGIFLSNWEI